MSEYDKKRREGYGFPLQRDDLWKWAHQPPLPQFLPLEERVMPETFSMLPLFWHSDNCRCGECRDRPSAQLLKYHRKYVLGLKFKYGSHLPPLPHLPEDLLQSFRTAERSTPGLHLPAHTEEQSWQPYGRVGQGTQTK